jgi:ATP-dependent 26S proteasome regulatory subunit
MTINSDLDKELIAEETDGFSGADLAALCREAGLQAIRRGLLTAALIMQ